MSALRLAVLVSGSGRTLRNILELEQSGDLPSETVLVIASRYGIKAIDRAAEFGVPCRVLQVGEVAATLDAAEPDLVIMAGYLRRWPIPARYVGRTVNIHPALLPKYGGQGFYGRHVHDAVLASGDRESGCSVHYVTEEYDRGPVIDQARVDVLPGDDAATLAARVFEQELLLLPQVIRQIAGGRIHLDENRTVCRS